MHHLEANVEECDEIHFCKTDNFDLVILNGHKNKTNY